MNYGKEGKELLGPLLGLLTPSALGLLAYHITSYPIAFTALTASIVYLGFELFKGLVEDRRLKPDPILMGFTGFTLLVNNIIFPGLLVMLLYGIAELLEAEASTLARRRLDILPSLIPSRVLVERGSLVEVDVTSLKPGDVIIVRRGEALPVDGVLLEDGIFDTSTLTGEPTPHHFSPGSLVYSGFINVGNPIRVKVTRGAGESRLRRIVDLALEALEEKSSITRVIEKYLWLWLPIVISSFIIAYMLLEAERAVSILIISCPSAFIISSSVNAAYSIASLAKAGLIVRGARALEGLEGVNVIVFDRTGTLTMGSPRISYLKIPEGLGEEEFKAIIASTASTSLHPVSRALSSLSSSKLPIYDIVEHPGLGLEAIVNGKGF